MLESHAAFADFRVMKVRESIHSVFLQHAILESAMDVGIVNAHEMIAYDELEADMKELCENLVFNKTPDATDDMLERTAWERACLDAKKKGVSWCYFQENDSHIPHNALSCFQVSPCPVNHAERCPSCITSYLIMTM